MQGVVPVTGFAIAVVLWLAVLLVAGARSHSFPERKYKSGSKWAWWRWTYTDSGYITRLHIVMTPLFAICVHWINKPDPEPYLHDHPVSFLSLVLKGWYQETRWESSAIVGDILYSHKVSRWNFLRAHFNDRHTIYDVAPGGCVTLALMTRKKRDWGFHVSEDEWIGWKNYYNMPLTINGTFYVTRKDFYKAVREGRAKWDNETMPMIGGDNNSCKVG